MKLLLLAAVVFVGGTAFLVWHKRDGAVAALPSLPFVQAHTQMPVPAKPVGKTKPAPKFAHFAKANGVAPDTQPDLPQAVVADASPAAVVAPTRQPVARVRMPFPLPDKVTVGADTDAVTNQYGDPSAWAVAAEDGHIVETLVYLRESKGPATVIRIVDGRVAAAYAKASPPPVEGSLIRNFGARN